jgi:hypothetical protein
MTRISADVHDIMNIPPSDPTIQFGASEGVEARQRIWNYAREDHPARIGMILEA